MRFLDMAIHGATILLLAVPVPLFAQHSTDSPVEKWKSLDDDFRQAIVEEFTIRRGLDSDIDSTDDLIKTAEDIKEVLQISCVLADACGSESDQSTLGEQLKSFPEYDELQGLLNSSIILGQKYGDQR